MALSAAFEPGDEGIGQLIAEFGAVDVVLRLQSRDLDPRFEALQRRWHFKDWLVTAQQEAERAVEEGVSLIVPGSSDWPSQLDDLGLRAPVVLRVKGPLKLRPAAARSVAVVGARAATQYGIWVAEELSADLADAGWCVISGGALGIDAASHRGALAVNGFSIAVTAAGANMAVPASNHSVFARLFDVGAVVSEVPLNERPSRRRFLVRNRVIAALAPVVVVVEAALRSGALSTAREADAMGRRLCAVPGPTTSALSSGCHDLIRNGGATLVTCADDVIEEVIRRSPQPSEETQMTSVDLIERRVLDICVPRSVEVTRIAEEVNISLSAANAILHLLERKGLVTATAKGWRTVAY